MHCCLIKHARARIGAKLLNMYVADDSHTQFIVISLRSPIGSTKTHKHTHTRAHLSHYSTTYH